MAPDDERIRELCLKAANATEPELSEILAELRTALREHARYLRQMTADALNRSSTKARG
jgi:uncharacterized coiled-coil protein SlyX